MGITISNIQRQAQGGYARMNTNTGQIVSGQKGRFGRVVAWFRAKLSPGQFAAENSSVMNAFVRAIADDSKYGPAFAIMAAKDLANRFEQHKPLSDRTINRVLDQLNTTKEQNNSSNQLKAESFSSIAIRDTPSYFCTLWAYSAENYNLPTDSSSVNTSQLSANIRSAILKAGEDGKRMVTIEEAKQIAQEHIGKFTETLATEITLVKSSDLSDDYKKTVTSLLMDDPEVKEGSGAKYANGLRIRQLENNGAVKEIIDTSAREKGLGDIQDVLDTGKLQDKITMVTSGGNEILSVEEMRGKVREQAEAFMTQKKAVLDHVDSLNLDATTTANMRNMVAGSPFIKSSQQVDVILEVSRAYATFSESVAGGEDIAGAFTKFQQAFDAAYNPLMSAGIGADDVVPYITSGLQIWLDSQGDKSLPSLRSAYDALTGEQGMRFADSLAFIRDQHGTNPQVNGVAVRAQNLRSMLASELSQKLDIEPTENAIHVGHGNNINSTNDVPDSVYTMLRDLGADVPLPDPVGRSSEGAFGARFTTKYLTDLNTEFGKDRIWNGYVSDTMKADFGRATFTVGDTQISEPGSAKERAVENYTAFFGNDEGGAKAVSAVTHQGLFAPILEAMPTGLGPIPGAIVFEQNSNKSAYTISRMEDGGYQVQGTLNAKLNYLIDENGMVTFNPDQSEFSANITFNISRESIDSGTPQAELAGPVVYSYACTPPE